MLRKLSLIRCAVADMDAAIIFYRDILGLSLKSQSPAWSEFDLGHTSLGLHRGEPQALKPRSGWTLSFEVSDVKASKEFLAAAGVTIVGDFHEIPGGVVLGISDPDGNPVDLVQQTG
jgi:predicted enzyme related to lactoylglutathione lyase